MPHHTFKWLPAGDGKVWFAWLHGDSLYTGRWHSGAVETNTVDTRKLDDTRQFMTAMMALETSEDRRAFGSDRARLMPTMWDATIDSTGIPWIVWSAPTDDDTRTIFCQRCEADVWGPRLQVSEPGANGFPAVCPDEYGNVWIVWQSHKTDGSSLWLCRMGPRSGQVTHIADGSLTGSQDVTSLNGVIRVAYMDMEGQLWVVEGTEHQGFGPPARIIF